MQQRITASSCATTPDREKTASSRAFQALLVYWIKLILLVLLAMLGIWALWQLAWGNNDATALKPLQHESPFPGHSINNGVGKMTTSMFNICHQRPLSLTILMTAFSGAILMSVSERFGDWIDRIKKRTHRLSRQMLLDAVDLPTLVVERDFRVVMANVAARSLMDDNQTPRLCYEIHHRDKPCVPKLEDCPVQRAFETGLTIRTRHRHFNRRGEAVYLNVTATPVRNKRGDVVQVIETFHDVSAEQYSFEERRQRENFLQTLINTVPAPIYYKNMKGIYLGCNPSFSERILGCTPEAVVGKSLFDFPIRIPTELAELYRRKDCELFERGGVQYYEAPVQCADNERREFLFYNAVFNDYNGRPAGIVGVLQDVTGMKRIQRSLRENEQRLQTILDCVLTGVMIIDADSHEILDVNPWAAKIIGRPREDIIGKICHKFVCPFQAGACPMTDQGHILNSEERNIINADGREIPILKSIQPLRLSGRDVLIESFVDISEHKIFEQQLQQLRKMDSIGRLASGIAHEINSPLQYVGDNTLFLRDGFKDLQTLLTDLGKLLEQHPDSDLAVKINDRCEEIGINYLAEEVPAAIEQSLQGIERVTQIVRAMRDFAHPGSNIRQNVDINRAIQTTVTITRNYWKYHAEVKLDLADSLPTVNCFAAEFNQVILNLLTNATDAIVEKFSYNDTTQGIIAITTRAGSGDNVEILISDNGCGIAPEIRKQIFEPFFTTKEVGKGTGQGLAIVRSIMVDKQGGNIDIESVPGEGTTFILRLPINQSEDSEEDISQETTLL